MLAYVPVVFEAYRQLKPRLWPVMQVLAAHADRAGRCWPSVRRVAEITGVPKSTVARYIRALEQAGVLARTWRRGSHCVYTIAAPFLPATVSQKHLLTVPRRNREENLTEERAEAPSSKETKRDTNGKCAPARAATHPSNLPDDSSRWQARLRAWEQSRFWLPQFGPRPDEPNCWVPAAVLRASTG